MSDSVTQRTVAHQAPLSIGFSMQECWVGCHFLLQGIFLTQGWNPCLLHLLHCRRILYHWLSHLGSPQILHQSVSQFSHSVMSDSLWPHESQHARPPCPSPTPGVHSNSCASNRWCHPASSSSVIPFSSCPQSLPASESFLVSQLFTWGGQSIGASASKSFLPMNIQDWSSKIDWFDLLTVQGTLKSLLQHHSSKASILRRSAFFIVQLSHQYMTTGKTIALTRQTLFFWAPKSLQMVTAAMKFKDAYSLEGKLWPT